MMGYCIHIMIHEGHECPNNASLPEMREEECPYNNAGYFFPTLAQSLQYTVTLK
jgi:hypothetical protein